MPEPLSDDELDEIVDDVIAEVRAMSLRDIGRVMADVMPRVSGKADGSAVSQIVCESSCIPRPVVVSDPWADPDWRAGADAWISEAACTTSSTGEPTGAIRPGTRPALVDGDPGPDDERQRVLQGRSLRRCVTRRHSPKLLGVCLPHCVPPPLAVDTVEGWMLMGRWREIFAGWSRRARSGAAGETRCPLDAELQIDLMVRWDDLLAPLYARLSARRRLPGRSRGGALIRSSTSSHRRGRLPRFGALFAVGSRAG